MATKPRTPAATLYGCPWSTNDPIRIERECIRLGGTWTTADGVTHGMGLPHHIISFAKQVWPWFGWHRWATDLILPQLSRNRARVGIFGPSSSSKSCLCGLTALTLYYASPDNTTVIVSSTTKDDLEGRIWGELKRFHGEAQEVAPWLPGHLIESKQLISTDGKGEEGGRDLRNGIMGVPVRKGGAWVGLGSLVGRKNDHMIAVADECHLMNEGFLEALANLESNPNFRLWQLGNLNDLSSQLGQACEPEKGWDSLGDSEISRVYPTRFHNGTAIQLIGNDSPNLDYPADAEPYPKLIGREYIKRLAHNYGVDTPLYNMFAAGKIPRGTMENRVLTKAVCDRHNAFEPVVWGHEPLVKFYGQDVSYTGEHGDRTAGRPFAYGRDIEGKWRLAPLEPPLIYTPNDRASGSIEEQIAAQSMAECKRLGIEPSHFFYDGTGRSSYTAALMRLWSTEVVPIEFGGTASTRPNFVGRRYQEDIDSRRKKGDLLPCNEVFGKMVTELWFAWRALIEADQCRNLDEASVKEGALRIWKLSNGNRMDVEPKKEMKLRLGRSPDLADCIVTAIEGARRLGFPLGQLDQVTRRNTQWISRLNRDYVDALVATSLAT